MNNFFAQKLKHFLPLVLGVMIVWPHFVLAQETGNNQSNAQNSIPTCQIPDQCRTSGFFSRGRGFIRLQQQLVTECRYAETMARSIEYANQYPTQFPNKYQNTNNEEGFGAPWYEVQIAAFSGLAEQVPEVGCTKKKYNELSDQLRNYRYDFSRTIHQDAIAWQQAAGARGDRDFDRLFYGIDTAVAEKFSNESQHDLAKNEIFGFVRPTDIYNPNIAAIPNSQSVFGFGKGDKAYILGQETNLKNYAPAETDGKEQFRTFMETLFDFIRRALLPVAFFIIVFMGAELFMGGRSSSEETIEKKKKQLNGVVLGTLFFALAITIVDFVVFGNEGEIFRDDAVITSTGEFVSYVPNVDRSTQFAKQGFWELEGIFDYFISLIVIFAVMFLVIAALRMTLGGANTETTANTKRRITYTILGIALLISARPILNIFTTGEGQFSTPRATPIVEFMLKWADYILGFLGILAVVSIVYGGIRLVLHFGDDEAVSQAKKVIQYAVIGLIIAFSAWTIINYFANPSATGLQTGF